MVTTTPSDRNHYRKNGKQVNHTSETSAFWSKEAERSLLGAILLNSDVLDEISQEVRLDDFYSHSNRIIFETMQRLHSDGIRPDDLTTLTTRLGSDCNIKNVGGEAYLAELMYGTYTTHNAVYYARTIRDHAHRRKVLEITGNAFYRIQAGDSVSDVRSLMEQQLFELDQGRMSGPASMNDALVEVFKEMDTEESSALSTGISNLDDMTGGLRKGQVVILAARPGMGKTALAVNMASNMIDSGHGVLFFSLEMSRVEISERLISALGEVPLAAIRNKNVGRYRQQIGQVGNDLAKKPLYIDDMPSRTMADIESIARRMIRKHGIRCIVIDHLGLVKSGQPDKPRYEQVTEVSRQLKEAAKRLQVPVVALAQLNRETTSGKDYRPKLSQLRDSGAIEQDADMVILIHREEYYDKKANPFEAELIIAKNRSGQTGDIKLRWEGEYVRFVEEQEYQELDTGKPLFDGKHAGSGEAYEGY